LSSITGGAAVGAGFAGAAAGGFAGVSWALALQVSSPAAKMAIPIRFIRPPEMPLR
jgi:hypothetical protein